VLLVVGQIGLGGAFGQITSDYDDLAKDAPSLVVDSLGSLSPLRWAYNAALVAEWRQTRCRVRGKADERCSSSLPGPKIAQQCVAGGLPPEQDTFMPGQATWVDINAAKCGAVEDGAPEASARKDGTLEPARRRNVALYFQASGSDADRLDRLLERRRLLDEREVLLPAQATSQAFAAQSYARLNEVRERRDPAKDLACYQREANLDYLYGLTETMVAKGMIRPSLLDVEWCWRSCPDVRPAEGTWRGGRVEPLAEGTFMLEACPDPGEAGSGDVMKAFFRPAVSLLDGSSAYPCRGLAHDLFVDRARFSSQVEALCAGLTLTDAEGNLLFWMLAVAVAWASIALSLAFAWSGRVARGA
jgi:hypothetical protein